MRILLIISLLFVFLSGTREKKDIKIDAGIFQVYYSETLEQPLEVWYTVQCPEGTATRKGLDFYDCDTVFTSQDADYENNVWDKGHMAPAADFSCDRQTIYKTFTYLNCALQHKDLNRGAWRFLEAHERELAKKNKVEVYIKLEFDEHSIKLPTGATIPNGFRKEIKYSGKTEVYYFKNEKPITNSYTNFIVK